MKVLAGVDGSKKSLDALQFTARFLNPEEDHFVFFFRPPEVRIEHEQRLIPEIPEDFRSGVIQRVFHKSKTMLPPEFREEIETIIGEKKPSNGLLEAAEQIRADLILVGADAKDRSFGPFLGGVARKVAREAKVPVLVFRATQVADADRPLNVLLAHDGSEDSTHAGRRLARFDWPSGTVGTVIRVMDWIDIRIAGGVKGPGLGKHDYEEYVANALEQTQKELMAMIHDIPPFLTLKPPVVKQGSAVEEICETAETEQADLIVVGPHGHRMTRRVLGATTESLLHYAPCSILVSR